MNGKPYANANANGGAVAVAPKVTLPSVPLSASTLRKLEQIKRLSDSIAALPSLYPCEEVNSLFGALVNACIDADAEEEEVSQQLHALIRFFETRHHHHHHNTNHRGGRIVNNMDGNNSSNLNLNGGLTHFLLPSAADRQNLIVNCAEAETLMEKDFALRLGAMASEDEILEALQKFRFIRNYEKLTRLEYHLLLGQEEFSNLSGLRNVAFVGSGPLPLTTFFLVQGLLPNKAVVTNYDIDGDSNSVAKRWMHALPALRDRVEFKTADILDVPEEELRRYDVIVLAALVGLVPKMKLRILQHLRRGMKEGSYLLLRSAEGAKAFLYPVVEMGDLRGWNVCSVTHPKGEVVNSVIVVTKRIDSVQDSMWG